MNQPLIASYNKIYRTKEGFRAWMFLNYTTVIWLHSALGTCLQLPILHATQERIWLYWHFLQLAISQQVLPYHHRIKQEGKLWMLCVNAWEQKYIFFFLLVLKHIMQASLFTSMLYKITCKSILFLCSFGSSSECIDWLRQLEEI